MSKKVPRRMYRELERAAANIQDEYLTLGPVIMESLPSGFYSALEALEGYLGTIEEFRWKRKMGTLGDDEA